MQNRKRQTQQRYMQHKQNNRHKMLENYDTNENDNNTIMPNITQDTNKEITKEEKCNTN